MDGLISRQAAIDAVNSLTYPSSLVDVKRKLVGLPSADAVEIVRCRDCKHNPNDTWFECPISHLPYKEDRWCWKGERKDD